MATISENLQTIKDSTDAIKQAIIDKGGDVSGDITTWANVISGLSGGGNTSEEYTFIGTLSYNMTAVTITGSLNKIPDTGTNYLLALGRYIGGITLDSCSIDEGPYTLTVDFEEPISSNCLPAICILNQENGTMDVFTTIPVKFQEAISTDPA